MEIRASAAGEREDRPPRLLTVEDVRAELNIGRTLVYRLVETGALPVVRSRARSQGAAGGLRRVPRREPVPVLPAAAPRPSRRPRMSATTGTTCAAPGSCGGEVDADQGRVDADRGPQTGACVAVESTNDIGVVWDNWMRCRHATAP